MTADGTPAVPDTEAVREALEESRDLIARHLADRSQVARVVIAKADAALARDVPAPTDEPDVWEIPDLPADLAEVWTEHQDTGEPIRWRKVPMFPHMPVANAWLWELAEGGDGGRYTDIELLGFGRVFRRDPAVASPVAVSDRAGDTETRAALPVTLASVDDVAAVCLAHGLTVAHPSGGGWDGPNRTYHYPCRVPVDGAAMNDDEQAASGSLVEKHGWQAESVDQRDGKLRFSDGDFVDYLPPGQWLVAMENCQQGHTHEPFGDPCICGSDNCAFCVRCGVEHHD